MRLYVTCGNCGNKIYIASPATMRSELPSLFYLTCPKCNQTFEYRPQHVFAESSDISSIGGALVGGLAGLLISGLGAVIGAVAGAILGRGTELRDLQAVQRFNNS